MTIHFFRVAASLCFSALLLSSCTKRGKDVDVQLADGTSVKAAYNETLRVNSDD